MRIARFSLNDKPRYAFVQQDPADGKDYLIELDGYPFGAAPVKPTGERYALDADGLRLLAPVIPSKVYGLAKNYEAHAQFMHESGHSEIAHAPEDMVIFSKPSTSVIGPDDPIVIPSYSNDMNFEPEVAVIMGRIAKNVPVEKAMDYVLGFTCVNDVTLRDLQGLDPMWTRAKGFDTSCPIGPWIQTELDWKDAKISFTLNGEDVPMASGTTANLIHGIPEQIAAISSFSTLLPGDVIMTGTPNASGHLDPAAHEPSDSEARLGRPQAVRNCGTVRGIARRLDRDVDDWLGESIPFEQQAQVGLGRGVGVLANLGECPDALFLPLERVA